MSVSRPSDRPIVRPTGFSLIEVMVATAVLAIMVVMIGGLFQQASSSWDAGYVRAEGGMAVRAVVGALTRDLAVAVDGRRFGLSAPVVVGPKRIEMYCLFPGNDGGRDLRNVVYSAGDDVTRTVDGTETKLYQKPESGSSYSASFSFVSGANTGQTASSGDVRPYEAKYFDANGQSKKSSFSNLVWTVPYVKVRCEMTRSGLFSGLTVRSLGRDGIPNEGSEKKDDIIVK